MEEIKMEGLGMSSNHIDGLEQFEVSNFYKVIQQIDNYDSRNQIGVMFYFGDTKVPSKDKQDKEIRYKNEFLKHCILSLATLQHGGSMVLKVYETYSAFTVGILFVLYHLFKTVAIVKPYNSSFLSSRQYVICKGLKQRCPQHQIGYLLQVQKHLNENKNRKSANLIRISIYRVQT